MEWINFLEANYDVCVEATVNGQYLNLPTAPNLDAKAGALTCGKLQLNCALDADAFSNSGYIGRDMHGSLAYPGFGMFDSNTDEGMLAQSMLDFDVSMEGVIPPAPATAFQSYEFRIANHGDAVFEVASGQFQIIDAHFVWEDYDLTITSDPASCTCINCTL